ncbi:MAG: glycosyltransferase [Cyanophyceae cyanobacterium]
MTRFGILCPPAIGHLNPMCALGRELQRRGHTVTLLGVPDVEPKVKNAGLNFCLLGEAAFPAGSVEQRYKQLGQLSGVAGLKFIIDWLRQETVMLFQEAPTALTSAGVEALLVDQITLAGGSIAERLNLPFITVCNALLTNREPGVPPYFTHWQYRSTPWAHWRNRLGNLLIARLRQPILTVINQQRQEWHLPPYRNPNALYSPLLQICQLPSEFDFPREKLPHHFHYTGPLQEPSGREPVSDSSLAFPWHKLTETLIYASLGTLQNQNWSIFETIATACADVEAQLVISLGDPQRQKPEPALPGEPLVVPYAPHQQLIEKASLVITHAGMNTVLGALSRGVPLVAIPITSEQPGIAARLARTGAGVAVPLAQLSVPVLRSAVQQVLSDRTYREQAKQMQQAIARAGGVDRAADLVEQASGTLNSEQ